MPITDPNEQKRLEGPYEGLRVRLLDLSRTNQLLNYNLRPRSKRFLQVIGCSLEDAHRRLALDEATLKISALPLPDAIPADERTEEFRAALDRAKNIDVEYLTALEALESNGRDDDAALDKLERELRDRVRQELELPPRPTRRELKSGRACPLARNRPPSRPRCKDTVQTGKGLQTLKFPDELEAVMEKIVGDARLAEQEMGLSTLFLAFGFLEWYESDSSGKSRSHRAAASGADRPAEGPRQTGLLHYGSGRKRGNQSESPEATRAAVRAADPRLRLRGRGGRQRLGRRLRRPGHEGRRRTEVAGR